MKPKYSLIAAIVVAIPLVLLMINTADSGSPGSSPRIVAPTGTANGQVESIGGPVETDTRLTVTPEATETLIALEQDSETLLQTYCAQCHSVKLLEKTRMSRTDWEKTLSRMERYSGLVNDTEKLMLLEKLVASDKR